MVSFRKKRGGNMKRRIIILLLVAIFTLSAMSEVAFAHCGKCSVIAKKEKGIINTTCPVMGGRVDENTPYKVEYNGKTIGFCCSGCVRTFKEDPEKYMKKIKERQEDSKI